MNQNSETPSGADKASSQVVMCEDFESVGDQHRAAAHHFDAAARHHLAAAAANDEGDAEAVGRHSFLAYRNRLNGVQYADIVVIDSECTELIVSRL
jgi:hypothetical protein